MRLLKLPKTKSSVGAKWWKGRICLIFGGAMTIMGLVIAVLSLLNDMDALPKSTPDCSCNGFIDTDNGGECLKEWKKNGYWCYVEDGSCSDAGKYGDLYYSYAACKIKTTAVAPTTSSPSNVADTNISPTIQVEVLLEMFSKMQSKEGSPITTTKSTTTTTTTTETTKTTTTTTTTITRKSTTTSTTMMTTTTITTTTMSPTTTTTILPGCSCNGFIDTHDGGECREEYGGNGYWCYVEDGLCSDAYLYGDLYYSYEACKTKATALGCSCNGFFDMDDKGECREEFGENGYWCYVEYGSCSDAYLYGDLYYSYEACKTKAAALGEFLGGTKSGKKKKVMFAKEESDVKEEESDEEEEDDADEYDEEEYDEEEDDVKEEEDDEDDD